MARERNYAAEYAARKARAQGQGYAGYREQRVRRAEARPLAADPVAKTQHRQAAGQTITKSRSPEAIRRAVEDAGRHGRVVDILSTFETELGPKSRWIEGAEPADVLEAMDDAGDEWQGIADLVGDSISQSIIVTPVPPPLGPVTVVAHGLFSGGR